MLHGVWHRRVEFPEILYPYEQWYSTVSPNFTVVRLEDSGRLLITSGQGVAA